LGDKTAIELEAARAMAHFDDHGPHRVHHDDDLLAPALDRYVNQTQDAVQSIIEVIRRVARLPPPRVVIEWRKQNGCMPIPIHDI
jgi:hypothetical protein